MSEPAPLSPLWRILHVTYNSARRITVAVIGGTVVCVGICMLVLPGPAFVVIPAGLAILGAEFAFARRWLKALKRQARNGLNAVGLGNAFTNSAFRGGRTQPKGSKTGAEAHPRHEDGAARNVIDPPLS